MTDKPDCQEVSLMVATALASSIIDALPKPTQAVIALNVKSHVRDIASQESEETGVSPTHSEAKAVLQTFFDRMVDAAKA